MNSKVLEIFKFRQHRKAFIDCLDDIEDDLDIREGAKCVVAAWDGKLVTSTMPRIIVPQNYTTSFVQNTRDDLSFPIPKPKSRRFEKLSQKLHPKPKTDTLVNKKRVFIKPQNPKGTNFP